MILEDQGRSARTVIAEDAGLFLRGLLLRSSLIAASRILRGATSDTGFGNTRTPIHGLTFHNSRSDQEIDSRFDEGQLATRRAGEAQRIPPFVLRGCRFDEIGERTACMRVPT